jgi:UDP-glucose:(heptosyl)LPS alpha-1,3-glucosyltransferase
MKLAILSRHFSRLAGGAESYAVQLAEAMRCECEITVISQSFDAPAGHFSHIAVPKLPIPSRWLNQLWFSWYSRRVTAKGFDIVHSHENVTHGQVQTIHVKTVHASLQQKKVGWLRRLLSPRLLAYLWIEKKRLCGAGHQVVFVSQLLLDETREVLPGLSSAVFIPPGVMVPELAFTPTQRAAARRSLGLAGDKMLIGFIGHDFKKKGLDTLLKAVALLPFEVQVLVIGKPDQAPRYADLVGQLGPGKDCRFLGVVREMSLVYGAIDCLAHPTTQDVFPMVLLEAMANHVPVVTSAAPFNTMADLLTDQVNALLLPDPLDAKALASALERVLTLPDLRKNMIQQGREFVQQYSWTEVKRQYQDVYRAALSEAQ